MNKGIERQARSATCPPMAMWKILAFFVLMLSVAALASPFFIKTPMPTEVDRQFFDQQLQAMENDAAGHTARGEKPLRVVFVGTSRMKNAAMDSALVTRSARAAGITRPVSSTFMSVTWGGGERFLPAFELLEQDPPDVVVFTTSLLTDDYSPAARRHILFRYLRSWMEGASVYRIFNDSEFHESSCKDFSDSMDKRVVDDDEWLDVGIDKTGPQIVANAARELAAQNTLVVLAEVPPTIDLQTAKPLYPTMKAAREIGLAGLQNVKVAEIPVALPKDSYCDWAHMEPSHAGPWQRALFSQIKAELNSS